MTEGTCEHTMREDMSRAAKGYEKYGKKGMQALAKAGRDGASEKKLDTIRDKHDQYNEGANECCCKELGQKECPVHSDEEPRRGVKEGETTHKDGVTKHRKTDFPGYPSDDLDWAYRRLTDIITNLNERFFKFDLFGATEGFQFTKYTAPGGKYGKHIDSSPGSLIRKLSFTLQLSNPEDYKGGELCLYLGEKAEVMKKEQGFVALFPSYVLHEVKPVTQGTRYSLVSWITGKPFK
jgi:PKHD-type hydroxylase